MDQLQVDVEDQLDNPITIDGSAFVVGSPDLVTRSGRNSRLHNGALAGFGEYIERVVRRNDMHQNKGERFAVWVNRAEEGEGDLT